MPRLDLYPFRFRDPLTGKWIRARYKAELHELKERYQEWEITGEPEIRHVAATSAAPYNPFAAPLENLESPLSNCHSLKR